MATIIRKSLVGEAADIANKAYQKASLAGNTAVTSLLQQQNILASTQQQLVQSTRQTLGNVQQNIYQAQRSKRATSAALGMIGQIAEVRDAAQLQTDISNELSNIINQAEQGAIGIAGQQSALNQALFESSVPEILTEYRDDLIESGNAAISRDIGRQVMSGFTGALFGGVKGLLGAAGATAGIRNLISPTGGIIKKALTGAGLGIGLNMILNDVSGAVEALGGTGISKYDKPIISGSLVSGGVLAGMLSRIGYSKQSLADIQAKATTGEIPRLPTGPALGLKDQVIKDAGRFTMEDFANIDKTPLSWREKFALEGNRLFPGKPGEKIKLKDIWKGEGAAAKTVGSKLKDTAKGIGGKLSNQGFLRMNPWVAAAAFGIGAVIGGIKGGAVKRYRLDVDALREQGTAQQFEAFGLDLDALADEVYNYKG